MIDSIEQNSIHTINVLCTKLRYVPEKTTRNLLPTSLQSPLWLKRRRRRIPLLSRRSALQTRRKCSRPQKSSSEDERCKKLKKVVGKKKKRNVVTSSESSSEEEKEIVVDIKETAPFNGITKLAERVIEIANWVAVSNANQTKVLDLGDHFVTLKVRERKNEVDGDILEGIARGETITIGTGTGESIASNLPTIKTG